MNKFKRECPDCGGELVWDSRLEVFRHERTSGCQYMELDSGERVFDNRMRAAVLESSIRISKGKSSFDK